MKEIKCPKCDAVFEMDASGYTEIANQIRGQEFENELSNRLKDQESKHEVMVKLAQQDIATIKDKEILDLRHQIKQHETEIEMAKNEARDAMRGDLFAFEKQVERLKNERKAAETETKLAVSQATNELEKRISDLEGKLELAETRKELKIEQMEKTNLAEIKAKDDMIRLKDEEIARVKDMKLKMSVKEIGEKLEQWCENQFNLVRATAFPQAYFEKDNESVKDQGEDKGTKGDYIFRDYDSNGVEYISIMFEMKDKMEGKKGQTNESHLAKLDKDRKKKNCEYAVLVSMLEPENELYNSGAVDMSHKYEKMYVVRPQEFIFILSIIRNEARKSLEIRSELAIQRSKNIDVENFENDLLTFQSAFGKNYETAKKYYEMAIKDIDATIKKLEKIKSSLTTSGEQLRHANNKTQGLTIKKLTHNNQTMKKMFNDVKFGKK